jgi:hypothetical protein
MTPEKRAAISASLKGNPRLREAIKRVHARRIASGEDAAIRAKIRATRIAKGDWTEYDDSAWANYRRRVRQVTDSQPLHMLKNFELRGRGPGKYHIDHIVSVKAAFNILMPPEFVGHISNLQMIPESENCSKQDKVHDLDLMALWFRNTKAIDP